MPPKFEGELAEPIFAPLPDGTLLSDGVLVARIRKMTALARRYGVEPNDGFAIAYAMACDLVPGFQVLHDDPHARALNLPKAYYGEGTKRKGSGAIPELWSGNVLIWVFSLFRKKFPEENESDLAARVVLCMEESLAREAHEKELEGLRMTPPEELTKLQREKARQRVLHRGGCQVRIYGRRNAGIRTRKDL